MSFPVVFNIGGTSRHEVIFIKPTDSISDISKQVQGLTASSVNCEEPLAKYKKKGEAAKVTTIKVRWSTEGRDSRIFPKSTVLTEENVEPILTMISQNQGKDVLEVDVQEPKPTKDTENTEDKKSTEDGAEGLPDRKK